MFLKMVISLVNAVTASGRSIERNQVIKECRALKYSLAGILRDVKRPAGFIIA